MTTTHLMNTYARLPVAFVRGQGVWLWDESGRRYLDALAGIAVNTLGHAHPKFVKAIADQAARLAHVSNLYRITEQERLGGGAEQTRHIVAVLVEPIQGEGGIKVGATEYLRGLREICDRKGWLLMFDEVQCGFGRTGKWFVYQHAGVAPDVLALAKGLAGGVPIGCCLARGAAAGVFKPGNHGSTFGGNSLACVAALATLEAIEQERLMENAERSGTRKASLTSAAAAS